MLSHPGQKQLLDFTFPTYHRESQSRTLFIFFTFSRCPPSKVLYVFAKTNSLISHIEVKTIKQKEVNLNIHFIIINCDKYYTYGLYCDIA